MKMVKFLSAKNQLVRIPADWISGVVDNSQSDEGTYTEVWIAGVKLYETIEKAESIVKKMGGNIT